MSKLDITPSIEEIGRQFAKGFIHETISAAFLFCGFIFLISVALVFVMPTDNSDAGRLNRSGLSIHTDHLTGCEYLVTKKGGIIRRETPCGEDD